MLHGRAAKCALCAVVLALAAAPATQAAGLCPGDCNDDGAVTVEELWKTNGTEAGTTLVRDISIGAAGSTPEPLGELDGRLVFSRL